MGAPREDGSIIDEKAEGKLAFFRWSVKVVRIMEIKSGSVSNIVQPRAILNFSPLWQDLIGWRRLHFP